MGLYIWSYYDLKAPFRPVISSSTEQLELKKAPRLTFSEVSGIVGWLRGDPLEEEDTKASEDAQKVLANGPRP